MYISILTNTDVHYVCSMHPLPQLWLCVVTYRNRFVYTSLYSKYKMTHWDNVSFYVASMSWSIFEHFIALITQDTIIMEDGLKSSKLFYLLIQNLKKIRFIWSHMKRIYCYTFTNLKKNLPSIFPERFWNWYSDLKLNLLHKYFIRLCEKPGICMNPSRNLIKSVLFV